MFQCITQPKNGLIYYSSEFKNVFPDIRVQLNEQLKCLDGRLETQLSLVSEFQDVFRRRAEIESAYARELDKLAKYLGNRNKEQKQKREGWHLFSSLQLWDQLVSQTRKASKDHSALADIYSGQVVHRCGIIADDLQRGFKKCREIGYEIHEEVLKVLHELHTAMKTHHTYQAEFRQAENKLQVVEKQRNKLRQSVAPEKQAKHRKLKLIEKEWQKRKTKYDEARLKATKARNEYLLCMDAANSSIQKYFVDDLSDLIDCMDFGFHQSLTRAVLMHVSGMDQLRRSLQVDIDKTNKSVASLDSRLDKQRFIEFNNATFMIPKKFEYAPVRRDESETVVQPVVMEELGMRKQKLAERLLQLKAESEEIWKSMETAEKTLLDLVAANDYDTTRFFVEEDRAAVGRQSEGTLQKQKADRREIEEFYMAKFRQLVLNSNRIARLQAKYEHIRGALGLSAGGAGANANSTEGLLADAAGNGGAGTLTMTRRPQASRRRRIGGRNVRPGGGAPKLFGGSLEEYLEETNQDIPLIVRSCVRVINLFGLHHHGIFRVSGSQVEINHFRDAFERGEDPLADVTDASDINSVAGVLKLYLRELREPVFPIQYFDHFMELAQLESKHDFVVKVRDVVKTWKRPVFIVMRYLFAFLNHLSEFSDENLMDPYNLAICFGPTLVPIPEERDQVQYQALVNELIKNFIIFHEDIFPPSVPGPVYEKYLTAEPDMDMGDSPTDTAPEEGDEDDLDGESEMTEDDSVFHEDNERDVSLELFGKSEVLEAQALYDFKARSSREVNFHKGDTIVLFRQVSNDWWRGSVRGVEGLIPDKYIMLKIRGEDDRERLESCRSIDESSLPEGVASTSSTLRSSSRDRHISGSNSQRGQPLGQGGSPRQRQGSSASLTCGDAPHGVGTGYATSPVAARRNAIRQKRPSPRSSIGLGDGGGASVSSTTLTAPERRSPGSAPTSTSSPDAASTALRSSSSTTVITVAGAMAQSSRAAAAAAAAAPIASRESLLSQDSGNPSPTTETSAATTTRMTCSAITTDSRSADTDSLLNEEEEEPAQAAATATVTSSSGGGGSTHIIRVTGPVTNLDETVMSGAAAPAKSSTTSMTASKQRLQRSGSAEDGDCAPRSRLPLSPSLGQQLDEEEGGAPDETSEAMAASNSSQDSLSSSGSNRELKSQLDSTIAQVEAFTKEIMEKRKLSTVSLSPALEGGVGRNTAASGAAHSEARQQRSVSIGGARPRLPTTPEAAEKCATGPGRGAVMLRESSWGSRDQALNMPQSAASSHSSVAGSSGGEGGGGHVGAFAKNRSMWEKKSTVEDAAVTTAPVAGSLSGRTGAFRAKDAWAPKLSSTSDSSRGGSSSASSVVSSSSARQRQTPDLVLGLPVSQQQRRKAGAAAATRTSQQTEQPVPKPRTLAAGGAIGGSPLSSSADASPNSEEAPSGARRRSSPSDRSLGAIDAEKQPSDVSDAHALPRVSAASAAVALRQHPQRPLESAPSSVTRPQVRVKPQVHSRRSPLQNDDEDQGNNGGKE